MGFAAFGEDYLVGKIQRPFVLPRVGGIVGDLMELPQQLQGVADLPEFVSHVLRRIGLNRMLRTGALQQPVLAHVQAPSDRIQRGRGRLSCDAALDLRDGLLGHAGFHGKRCLGQARSLAFMSKSLAQSRHVKDC